MFKICFKYLIFLENINIGHLKIDLTGLFLAPKIFRKEMDNIHVSIILLCTLSKMF